MNARVLLTRETSLRLMHSGPRHTKPIKSVMQSANDAHSNAQDRHWF